MPQILYVTVETDAEKRPQGRDSSRVSAADIPRVPRHRGGGRVLASRTLFTLWCRMLHSYQHTTPANDVLPFVFNTHSGQITNMEGVVLDAADNKRWQYAFGGNASEEAMIFYLYYALADVDSAAWVIAFCIIDKLQLRHVIDQHMGQSSDDAAATMPFRFHLGNSWRNLFVAFCLALKWHIDYSVTLNYVVGLLPHASQECRYLLRTSARAELQILSSLDYNVFVYPQELLELLDHFLAPNERGCIMNAISDGTTEEEYLM